MTNAPRILVAEALLRDTAIAVMQVQAEPASAQALKRIAHADLRRLSLEELGADSLTVAEIVAELEDHLGVLLELAYGAGLRTFADLREALRPAGVA